VDIHRHILIITHRALLLVKVVFLTTSTYAIRGALSYNAVIGNWNANREKPLETVQEIIL